MRTWPALTLAILGCTTTSIHHAPEPGASRVIAMRVFPAPLARGAAAATPVAASAPIVTPIDVPRAEVVAMRANVTVRKAPGRDARPLGVVRKGTRAAVKNVAYASDGCASGRWLELAPRGWLCDDQVEPSALAPTTAADVALDSVDDADVLPGNYGFVRGNDTVAYRSAADAIADESVVPLGRATSVRGLAVVSLGGRRFWRTSEGQLIDEDAIVRASPSKFKGVVVDDAAAMPAWARGSSEHPVALRDDRGRTIAMLAPRTVVHVIGASEDGARVQLREGGWALRRDLHVAELTAPPSDTGATERWFDVDRDAQVLVAYEGTRPVYATLVSTGKWQHETPTEVARIMAKHRAVTMSSDKKDLYSVADVPWTMYYDRDFALHASYWHDGFGGVRSHGCVNLAPRDARVLYTWSSPDVPPGWSSVYADEDVPGSLVRVRTRAVPEPSFVGYAKAMRDAARVAAN